jgi:ATP-binding cassette subfamily C protein CydC
VVRAVIALDPDPRRLMLAVLAGTAALGSAVALMATSGWLISRAAQQPPVLTLQVAVVATRAFGISRGVLRYVERLASHDVALRAVVTLRERLYRALATAEEATVAALPRGDMLARLGADVDTLADVLVRSLLPFAVAWTTVLASAVLVTVFVPVAGAVVAGAMVLAAALAPALAARAAARAEADDVAARAELSAQVLAMLDGTGELIVAGAVPERLARVREQERAIAAAREGSARGATWASGVATAATGGAVVATLALGVAATAAGRLDSVLLAVITLTPLAAAEAVSALPAAAVHLVRSRAAAARVLDLLEIGDPADAVPTSETTAEATPGTAVPAPAGPPPRLQSLALDCGRPGRGPVLRGLDLDLPPGRRIGVVGPSGSGKTTALLTLAGLLPPLAGRVLLDGEDLDALAARDESRLRRTVSFTAEDAHVFATTVRENLKVADPRAPDDALHAVLDRVGLGPWIGRLPRGLDTLLPLGGHSVSGGERRRLLLARALLVDAPVLLIDEPAEHLDPTGADALVEELLSGRATDASVILVTHRLTPLAAADEVLVLDGGRITARGRHEDLLARHPPYAEALAEESTLI